MTHGYDSLCFILSNIWFVLECVHYITCIVTHLYVRGFKKSYFATLIGVYFFITRCVVDTHTRSTLDFHYLPERHFVQYLTVHRTLKRGNRLILVCRALSLSELADCFSPSVDVQYLSSGIVNATISYEIIICDHRCS